ncbi:MAG: exodeoxyribonuclease V subunit alpha [Chthoniobacterales bacterium]
MTNSKEPDTAEIDRQFATFISRFGRDEPELVRAAASRLSWSVRQGHICFDLTQEPLIEGEQAPDPAKVRDRLRMSPAFGSPDEVTPIVIAGDRLFLRRYWDYEQALAAAIVTRARANGNAGSTAADQEAAIVGALENRFTIISGGPGTGKTTTVLQILLRLLRAPDGHCLRIALTAPTGKAAARLQELLRKVQDDPTIEPEIRERMPRSASTIHRLLKWKPDSVFFRHNARNPLPLDLLVVDEASMVALPLMAKLFEALPARTRVILLGDRDQLASVEPGAVLADMAEAASVPGSPLTGSLFALSRNYRFGNENAIYRLSQAIRAGDVEVALPILTGNDAEELASAHLPEAANLHAAIGSAVVAHYSDYLSATDPSEALARLGRFRVLCALRQGPHGVEKINSLVESALREKDLIPPSAGLYRGMPLLVTRNDYQANLFNGDIGVILPDPTEDNGQLWAWFIGADNQPRRISPARLPEHELAYAMTVHKAQGSEFESVLLILSAEENVVMTRELVYTGLTRASKKVTIWYDEDVLRASVGQPAKRRSGLRDALLAAG